MRRRGAHMSARLAGAPSSAYTPRAALTAASSANVRSPSWSVQPSATAQARGATSASTPWPSMGSVSGCSVYCVIDGSHQLPATPASGPSP